jgi:hypothetical protein
VSNSIVFNPQIAALHLCSQPTAIFIFGTAKFARSEFAIHCEHPGEPQINTCGFVLSSFFPTTNRVQAKTAMTLFSNWYYGFYFWPHRSSG